MKRIVKFDRKSTVEKAKSTEVRRLVEHGALALDAKAAIIQKLIPLWLMHIFLYIKGLASVPVIRGCCVTRRRTLRACGRQPVKGEAPHGPVKLFTFIPYTLAFLPAPDQDMKIVFYVPIY